jgi:hypothetical protein
METTAITSICSSSKRDLRAEQSKPHYLARNIAGLDPVTTIISVADGKQYPTDNRQQIFLSCGNQK